VATLGQLGATGCASDTRSHRILLSPARVLQVAGELVSGTVIERENFILWGNEVSLRKSRENVMIVADNIAAELRLYRGLLRHYPETDEFKRDTEDSLDRAGRWLKAGRFVRVTVELVEGDPADELTRDSYSSPLPDLE